MKDTASQLNVAARILVALAWLALTGCGAKSSPLHDPTQVQTASATPVIASDASNSTTSTSSSASKGDASDSSTTSNSSAALRNVGWVSIAIGAQAAIVAIATSFIMLDENGMRSDNCNAQKVCSSAGVDANQKIDALAPWNAGAWVVAAAGVGVGTYLVITNPPDSSPKTAIGVGPNGSGVGLNFRGSF